MSTEVKFESHNQPAENISKGKVKLTDLLSRLNEEKKKERFMLETAARLFHDPRITIMIIAVFAGAHLAFPIFSRATSSLLLQGSAS